MKPIGLALALATLTSGCTFGMMVDDNFNQLGYGGFLTFYYVGGGDGTVPPGWEATSFSQSEYVSFDSYAPSFATNSAYAGVSNVQQAIPPGEYFVGFTYGNYPPVYQSNNFMHTYDEGGCTDGFTGVADKACEFYLFQLSQNCSASPCAGASCPVQPLPTHNGSKVIQICLVE